MFLRFILHSFLMAGKAGQAKDAYKRPCGLNSFLRGLYIFSAAFFMSAGSLFGYSLQGKVLTSKGQPIADVYISLEGLSLYAVSTKDGNFRIDAIAPGVYNVHFSHVSYNPFSIKNVFVNKDTLFQKPVTLQARVHRMAATVITAYRDTQPAGKSADAINTIDALAIRLREAKNPAEALREEGVAVQKTSHGGGSAILRGLSSNRILLLVDGVRLNNALYRLGNHQYLTTVDVSSLTRMEVQHGPGSVLYGSDALGGSINLITFSADSFSSSAELHGNSSARYACADQAKTVFGQIIYRNSNWIVRAGFSANSSNDLRRGSYNPFKHTLQTGRSLLQSPSAFNGYDLNINLAWKNNSRQKFIFTFQRSRQFNVPRYDKYENNEYYLWQYQPQERDLVYLRHVWEPHSSWLCRLQTSVSLHRQGEGRQMRSQKQSLQTNEYDADWSRGVQISAFSRFAASKISYGLDIYSDLVHSRRSLVDPVSQIKLKQPDARYPDGALYNYAGFYLLHSYAFGEKIIIHSGLRFSLLHTKFNLSDTLFKKADLIFRALTPSIGLVYQYDRHLSIRTKIARGFRAPNLSDLAKFGQSKGDVFEIPNQNLHPERLLSLEIGAGYQTEKLISKATLFYSFINDILESVPALYKGSPFLERQGQIFKIKQKANTGKAAIHGIEFEAHYRLGSAHAIRGLLTSTFGRNINTNRPLSKIPPVFGLLSWQYQKGRIRTDFFSRFALQQKRLSPDDLDDPRIPEGGTPAWFTLNIRAFYKAAKFLNLHFAVRNILDLNYREHASGINAPGRNFILTITFNW